MTWSQEHKLLPLAENQLSAFTADGSHPPVFLLRGTSALFRPLGALTYICIHPQTDTYIHIHMVKNKEKNFLKRHNIKYWQGRCREPLEKSLGNP